MSRIPRAVREREDEPKKPTRYFSKLQEDAVAQATGGRRTANSGATAFGGKSDVAVGSLFNLECKTKTTHADSISIKREWFDKNKREALFDGHPYSAIVFNFGPDEENHYIIDEELFQELLTYLESKESR